MKDLNDEYSNSNGTENYYEFESNPNYVMTDCVEDLVTKYEMDPLMVDLMNISARHLDKRMLVFIIQNDNGVGKLTVTDGNEVVLVETDKVNLCSIPDGLLKIWLMHDQTLDSDLNNIFLLPVEY